MRFAFLLITCDLVTAASRRKDAGKTAEILILRYQLAVQERRQLRRPSLNWADRAMLATLLSVIPNWPRVAQDPAHRAAPPGSARLRARSPTASAGPAGVSRARLADPLRRWQESPAKRRHAPAPVQVSRE
jgi:hypothetical protein